VAIPTLVARQQEALAHLAPAGVFGDYTFRHEAAGPRWKPVPVAAGNT
jgi:hypothetical protein